jgi:hypothetical protein
MRQPAGNIIQEAPLAVCANWAIPCSAIIFFYIVSHCILTVLVHYAHLRSKATVQNGVPGPIRGRDFAARLPNFLTFVSIPLTYVISFIAVYAFHVERKFDLRTLRVLGLTWLFPLLLVLTYMLTSQRNNPIFPIRGFVQKIRFLVLAVLFCLVLAFSWGRVYEPFHISHMAISKVFLLEITKAEPIEGRMLFDLNGAIILFNKQNQLIVIPHEKIQKIETPRGS